MLRRFHDGPQRLDGGLGIGTLFTLFVQPAFYLLLAQDKGEEEVLFDSYEAPPTGSVAKDT